jgi:hypothetical protein
MKTPAFLLLFTTTIAFAFSCNKDETCKAGKGGNLTLVVYPQHHGESIFSQDNYRDTVYIKYNTNDAPGTGSSYDLTVVGEENENHVHIPDMGCGSYYIYAVGYDTMINQRVKGGIPFNTTQKNGEITIKVPVTE